MSFKNKLSRKMRAANSLLMTLTAIPVALSSIYLYFAPYDAPYRNVWDNLHVLLGFVLIGSFVLHIPMNWRPIRSYLRTKTRRFARPRAEGLAALTIFVLLMLGGISYPALSQIYAPPSKAIETNKAAAPFDANSAASAGITAADTDAAKTASAATGTKITYVAADISSCGNCDLIRDEGGCHSGLVFNLKGTVYFGSASGVSYIQQVVDNVVAADSDSDSENVAAVPEGIDPTAAAQPADTQVASVPEGGGRHGGRN